MAILEVSTGQEVGVTATFYEGDTLTEPTDPKVTIVAPDLTKEEVTTGLVSVSTGVKACYKVLNQRGTWAFRVEATTPATAYEVLVEAVWGNTE